MATTPRAAVRTLFTLATLMLAAGAARPQEAQAQGEFRWRGRLEPGRTIEVKGVLGDIRALPASGNEIEVVATRSARRSDPDEVTVEVVEHAGGFTICAVYPSDRSGRPNECAPGEGGRMSTRNNDVQVDFTVRIPPGVRFAGRTVNGEVEATSLQGDVEAHTVNGGIRISTTGLAEAFTVNGSIAATLGRADWASSLEFRTVNGGITVDLPAGTSADVRAETVNGSISTDFPLQVQGKFNTRRIRGTIGQGGRGLDMATVNGSIRLRKTS